MNRLIEDMNLSTRTYYLLKRHGFHDENQLKNVTLGELKSIRNIGSQSTRQVLESLAGCKMTQPYFLLHNQEKLDMKVADLITLIKNGNE